MLAISKLGKAASLAFMLFFSLAFSLRAQFCENQALAFDGAGDYIELNPINNLPATSDFTAEAWFTSTATSTQTTCPNNFLRLLSFGDVPTGARFELGECGGLLNLFWSESSCPMGIPVQIYGNTIRDGNCHHIAWVRKGMNVEVFLDGVSIYSNTFPCTPAASYFRAGKWPGGTPGQEWQGMIDEIRLWNIARTGAEIDKTKDCVLSPTSGLIAYWTLDENADPGNANPLLTMANDFSGNLNHGTLNGFALNGTLSNWVCNPCPLRYEVNISDNPSLFPVLLTGICSGDPAHFCITENFTKLNPIPGASVVWQSSDDNGQTWGPITDPHFTGYCFGIPKGVIDISASCATSTTGYVDRKYRAKITKTNTNPNYTCTYTTSEQDLRICCPPTGTITLTPVPPFNPPVNTLCEGTVTINVSLSGPPYLANLPIQWCIDGVHNSIYDNMTSFTYTGPATAPQLCFEAKIQNCACPLAVITACLPVDPRPVCTNLIIDQIFSNVVPNPLGGPYDYLICPGGQETLAYTGSTQNCTPVWQFKFDVPANDPWKDLGASNLWQLTNTLPLLNPPNPASAPQLWPANANCIYYRIECRPKSYPNSDCPSCYSNVLSICLKPNPLLTPVIAANPNPICEGGTALISNTVSDPNVTQEQWFCNGLSVGPPQPPGSTLTATQQACYQLSVTDGCYTKFSNVECLKVCDPVAKIKCPEDNPCACLGMPSTFDGSMSYSNCGPIVKYEWKVLDWVTGVTQNFSGPTLDMFVYTVPAGGASITLCITDSNGCMEISKALDIKPCE